MNRAIAKVYAISITHEGHALTVDQKCRIADVVPELIAEIERLEQLARPAAMTTVADAVFGTRNNCKCVDYCRSATLTKIGQPFRCRLTAK